MPADQANRQALRELLPAESEPLAPMPPELAGKTAPEPEVVRWVARNIDNPDPDPRECPDPFAWTLLRQCREDPSMRLRFIGDLWARLLPPAGRPEREADGAPVADSPAPEALAKLRAVAGECCRGR